MAKIKICLDTGCTRYIHVDDGRTIETPLDKCKPKSWSDKERKDWRYIVENTREAIKVSNPVFKKAKVGDEVNF